MMRLILSCLLAMALAMTSVTAAVARGQGQGISELVICSGYGVVTITLDEKGNPTGPVHSCPVCLAAMGPALLPDAPQPHRPLSRAVGLERPMAQSGTGRSEPAPNARGPPLFA
jgi:hypothetical protein